MEADKRDADTIRAVTGFHRDAKGNWRFEISDDQAKWKRVPFGRGYKLSEVLDHPTLFKIYPQLKDLHVRTQQLDGFVGWYKPKEPGVPGEIVLDMTRMNRSEIFQTLLHEVQHAVQDEEGILEGYQMRTPDTLRNELALRLNALEKKEEGGTKLTPAESKQLTELQEAEELIQKIEDKGQGKMLEENLRRFAPYSSQFHEAEAYDTMNRQKLTPAERRVVPLNPPSKVKWSDFIKLLRTIPF